MWILRLILTGYFLWEIREAELAGSSKSRRGTCMTNKRGISDDWIAQGHSSGSREGDKAADCETNLVWASQETRHIVPMLD